MTADARLYKDPKQALGMPEDERATNATDSWSMIALLKGLYYSLTTGGITVSGGSTAANQTTIIGHLDGLEGSVDGLETLTGAVNETAPATDTASSGVNGRLQRIAQRLTSAIALLPASLGGKAAAASLAVTTATDDPPLALLGAVGETAPATDTASSGLNGRLQRIAQRITSLIALVPASLGAKTAAGSFSVTMASDDALLSGTATASITALASSASSAQLVAANAARKACTITNTDANDVYVKLGTTASATDFTVIIPGNGGYWEMPLPPYTGRIDAIWSADGSGSAYATQW